MRREWMRVLSVVLGLGCAAGLGLGAVPGGAGEKPEVKYAAVIGQLGEGDFARRDAAQRVLENLTLGDVAWLRKAAAEAGDPEVQGRLAAAALAIEDRVAMYPPPIDLSLDHASASDLVAALEKVVGTRMDVNYSNARAGQGLFTIQAKQQPLWEVIRTLSPQGPMTLQSGDRPILLVGSSGMQGAVIAGPVLLLPTGMVRGVNMTYGGAKETSVSFSYLMAVDPRVRVARYGAPRFKSMVDDKGNEWVTQAQPDALSDSRRNGTQGLQTVFYGSVGWSTETRATWGTRLASAKGTMHFQVEVGEVETNIEDVENKVGQEFMVGRYRMKLETMTGTPMGNGNATRYIIRIAPVRELINPLEINDAQRQMGRATLLDGEGKVLAPTIAVQQLGSTFTMTAPTEHKGMTLRIQAAERVKEVVLPFELKDLPLP